MDDKNEEVYWKKSYGYFDTENIYEKKCIGNRSHGYFDTENILNKLLSWVWHNLDWIQQCDKSQHSTAIDVQKIAKVSPFAIVWNHK